MLRKIILKNTTLYYELHYKNVKNINLRIKADGKVYVSANRRIAQEVIDDFIMSKADLILRSLKEYENKSPELRKKYFSENEICDVILYLCEKVYPYFEKKGVKYPEIKFRKMVSQWGNCRSKSEILTFNKNLMYAPLECIEYVVLHEFTHFLESNHSKSFYDELAKVCPDWKTRKAILNKINIR